MDDFLKEILGLESLDPKQITRKIIELHMSAPVDSIPEDLRERFLSWLAADRNMDIKDEVLREFFDRQVRLNDEEHGQCPGDLLEMELLEQ